MTQPTQPTAGSQHIRERINRKLDTLAEDRLYQVLDYVEFLESRYAQKQTAAATNPLTRFAEGIEDRLRAGRVSATTIAETMGLLNRAVGVLNGAVAAGKSVATDLATAAQRMGTAVTDVATGVVSGTTGSTPAAGETPAQPGATPAPPAQAPPQQPPTTPPSGEVVP